MYYDFCESPIGLVEVGGTSRGVTSLGFVEKRRERFESHPAVGKAVQQVMEYFAGKRRTFELELSLSGTEFQEKVWRQLLTVPYGHLASYQDIAKAIGRPKAVRPVGAANGQNPIAIIVPCHRIIGSSGNLTGYGGGLWRKEWLLKHEGCILP
ncbi:MAG: methylated-DNA--[protein]-cysteine S-methyltransferase [Deltaproteobacteria bacterium]|nr:MAG: methylated-DNA--[protein]-cysteine S-methyltransferase [Deltaproteobacteria bacterium]